MSEKIRPPRDNYRRQRGEFRAWLIWQLNLRGANLPPAPKYSELKSAVERYLLNQVSP